MSETDDYCELCDLPRSQCIHGRPPPEPAPVQKTPPRPRTKPVARATTKPPTPRRWTPPELLKPIIVQVLEESGGEMHTDAALEAMESAIGEDLRPGDRETTPNGELRWHYAARRARQALVADGQMTKTTPGVWKLAES